MHFKKSVALPLAVAIAMASFAGASAFAQTVETTASDPGSQGTFLNKRYHDNAVRRPLTVRRRVVRARGPVGAPVAAAGAVAGAAVAAPVAAASTLVGLPFQVIGTPFLGGGGPRKGGVTAVRYVNAGPETDKIDEGWGTPVPVDKSGPIYVVENGDPTISPLTFVGAPILAAGAIVQLPFRILGAGPGTL